MERIYVLHKQYLISSDPSLMTNFADSVQGCSMYIHTYMAGRMASDILSLLTCDFCNANKQQSVIEKCK